MPKSQELVDKEIAVHLAEKVRLWRQQYGLSLREMGAMLDISPRTLEGIEQGRGFRYPNLLAHALDGIVTQAKHIAKGMPMRWIGWDDDTAADAGTGGQGTGDRDRHAGGDAQGRRDSVHQHRPREETGNAQVRPGRSGRVAGKE